MAKYSYITDKTHNNRKIQVESAKRDGSGKNIENNYAKQNGNYQSLTAGLSNNFDTKQVMVDESAYNFRPTATMGSVGLEVGSPCKVKKIIGGSVAFNQLINPNAVIVNDITFSVSNGLYTINGTASSSGGRLNKIHSGYIKVVSGHKYLVYANNPSNLFVNGLYISNANTGIAITFTTDPKTIISVSETCETAVVGFSLVQDQVIDNVKTYIQFFDLTQMFGSTIADYIYSLEQANAGSGVAWFKRYFPKEYYAYNRGELVSVKTQGKKITHFNQWDEEWELGSIDANGVLVQSNTQIRSKNFCKAIPNTSYYCKNITLIYWYDNGNNFISRDELNNASVVSPSNTAYFKIRKDSVTTYNHDICINFHYDGERDGEYEPYNSETYSCDDIELRGIPQLDENNNLAFNGDEYSNDGNVKRKYGIVDLGTLEWVKADWVFYAIVQGMSLTDTNRNKGLICTKYPTDTQEAITQNTMNDKTILRKQGYVYVRDSSYSESTSSQFKTDMSGVYLIYELATPTDENSIPFTEVQECDNWGTEEWLVPTTDTRPCEVPVGHETDYLPDLKAKLEVAPNTPNENGVYVMEHNASGNSYTPIATWLTDNGYAKADTLPTKDSVGGTLRQLLAVKETLDFDNTNYVDLGTLTWTYLNGKMFADLTNAFVMPNQTDISPIVCTKYKSSSINNVVNQSSNGIITLGNIGYWGEHRVAVYDSNYTNATTFKNAMKGVLLAYEKAS